MKNLLLVAAVLFSINLAQSQDFQEQFYKAYLNTSLPIWKDGISKLEKKYADTKDASYLLEAARAAYGSIGSCFAKQDMDTAEEMVEKAEEHLNDFIDAHPDHAEATAIKAGVYGMKIALSPIKGMFYGPKSSGLIADALKIDSENAMVQFQQGSSLYHTPKMFGGDLEKSAEHLELSKKYYEKEDTSQNWEYLNTLATLGQAYHRLEKLEMAKSVYDLALTTEPQFGWVKFQLLPALERDMK